ncbi:dihydropteroate synthase [Kamptonema cortianum]|uniref:Dihydropteroate synthase n=1 Tax=Geitlerinema calcuttense NRMC-F 0142 TaxID=2922238 RepID=A0ABT7M1Z2_9CYAN|nr:MULTISPECIES: dihydropteroate synthase [Cyanophyceae]MDK3161884.1 dihydropteroate synthase [Kamptonema cortianum]MDL5050562.1 dihydropteroate synthase [Oscillatoria amoena NRMC-F 0135]MDL5055577.1 dihydropteroate synthase [Oscillatoria laete-virens NRMC-F 0139]MDL5057857.1 dihydropteroate synthase [Geitlerinema calcuttense NRMC-F 0142]
MRFQFKNGSWQIAEESKIFAILNVTPDSFFDGGKWFTPAEAVSSALQMLADGADAIDVGGESSRPGATPVSEQEEMDRVLPVIRGIRAASDCVISIDTYKPAVADAALQAGAQIVNDISAGRDPGMAGVIRQHGAGWILMHMRGTPQDMQIAPAYENVTHDVFTFLHGKTLHASRTGIPLEQLAIDPGIGFGKTPDHNLELLAQTAQFARELGLPVMVGTSRKSFLGKISGSDTPDDRLPGSLASILWAHAQGARFLRVHDVKATRLALTTWEAIRRFA